MATKRKQYNAKVYNSSGSLISTIQPNFILSEIEFDAQLNGGVGVCEIKLNLSFDDFANEVGFVEIHNSIRIFEFDNENVNGQLIFTGEIMQITPILEENEETVTMVCVGLSTVFNYSLFKQGASFAPSYTATDPGDIVKDIADQVATLTPFLEYSSVAGPDQTIFQVGTNVDVDFETGSSLFTAMEKCVELSGENWNWFVDGQGKLWFKEKPSSATHILQVGDDVRAIENEIDGGEIVNDVTIAYSGGTFNKTDASSVASYGTRLFYLSDTSIKNATTAEQRADKELERANPVRRVSLAVNSRFNFENISVGDTVRVRGLKSGSITLDDNTLITGFEYTPDVMALSLGEFRNLASEIKRIGET